MNRCRDSQDLIHRLFVCISGVADQLQTNFASDLRNILKVVFQINSTPEEDSSGGQDWRGGVRRARGGRLLAGR